MSLINLTDKDLYFWRETASRLASCKMTPSMMRDILMALEATGHERIYNEFISQASVRLRDESKNELIALGSVIALLRVEKIRLHF